MIDTESRPVLTGFVALVVAALALGILGGVGLVFGAGAVGFNGDDDTSAATEPAGGPTLYLPTPTPTETEAPETTEPEDTVLPTQTAEPVADELTLTAAQTTVPAMGQIDLSGTYPQGDGAILQVQRFENDAWTDFPVTVSVKGQAFGTYVMTGRTGPNKFRVIDTDSGKASNEVEVTVG